MQFDGGLHSQLLMFVIFRAVWKLLGLQRCRCRAVRPRNWRLTAGGAQRATGPGLLVSK